jgi:TetR/AcrR family transcriptional repressor of nem operon
MRRETEKGTATRLRIVRTAADLFHKKGVVATSPDEIIEASGTGKGQFYHYFKNKDGLVHEVLSVYLSAIEKGLTPVNYDIRSWADLEKWFFDHLELQTTFSMTRGCPFGTIGNGVTEDDELIRVDLMRIFDTVRGKLSAFFIMEKARGRLMPEADETKLAEFCLATVQGAMLMGKIRRDADVVEVTMRQALEHLKRYETRPV